MFDSIISLIRRVYQSNEDFIPLHAPVFNGNEKKYLMETIDSTYVSSVGAFVDRFEEMIAQIAGTKYAIAVVNGTAALHIALKLAGVKEEEEVLSQPLTFVATTNAISYEKAIPHFIDVDEDTLGMSPVALKQRLQTVAVVKGGKCYNKETGRRIAACVPMHTFGLPLRIDEITEICNEYHIPVIEDAAESLGSYYKGRHTGSFALMGTFSFNGNKTVTSGGGGAIVTNNEGLAKLAKHITTTAKIPHRWEYVHDQVGYNYRMPNLNAALACAQLEQLDVYIENKRETAKLYQDFFNGIQNIECIKEIENANANYWLNAIRFDHEEEKLAFLEQSNDNGVMTRPVWRLMNGLSMFKHCPKGNLSIAESLEKTIVNIPSSIRL